MASQTAPYDLRRAGISGGKSTWLCQYSHHHDAEPTQKPMCRRCHQREVYSEGLCYPCWYYR